jgi:hypothetical protein
MNSSGIKRGLAISAVSAMAITGLGMAGPAFADSIPAQVGNGTVVLYTGDSGQASFKNDGVDSTVHLVAGGGSDVKTVQFSYNAGSGDVNIGSPVSAGPDGYFQLAWTPPTSIYNLPVTIKAQGISQTSTPIAGATDSSIETVSSNADSVNLSSTPSSIGVYQQPNGGSLLGIASGTTSDVSNGASIHLSTPYGGSVTSADTLGTPANGSRTFSGVVDFTGYSWDSSQGGTNDGVIQATDGSDDATAVSLYQQTISAVSASVVPDPQQDGKSSTVTISVVDQKGAPIAGAAVFMDDGTGAPDGAIQYTDSSGHASFSVDGTPAGVTKKFDVDVNANGSYDATTDFQRTVTVKTYSPTLTSLKSAATYAAFDQDEVVAAGDITITATDQNGNGISPQANLVAKWTTTPFGGGTATTTNATLTDNGDGTYTVSAPASAGTSVLSAWVETDGTPGESAGDVQAPDLTVKMGQASITWTDGTGDVVQGAAGTTQTVHGVLALPDGTPLPGRNVSLGWTDFTDGAHPAVVANNAAQPAGTTRVSDTQATTTTGNDGSFGVALIDPTQAAGDYVVNDEGSLGASTANTDGIGDALTGNSTLVEFLKNAAVANISSGGSFATIDGTRTPGRPAGLYGIRVTNSDGQPLAGQSVTVSVDHGFIADYSADSSNPGHLVADPAQSEGGEYGDWKSLGTSETVKTDDNGSVRHLRIAIGRDAGFDDDGIVDTTVTFTAGGVSQTQDVQFNTTSGYWNGNVYVGPLNLKDVSVDLAPAAQQDANLTVLPKAATENDVNLQVRAHDQFGNLVSVPVDLASNGAGNLDDDFAWSGFGTSVQDDVYADSGDTGDQNITAQLDERTPKSVWHNTGTADNPIWTRDQSTANPLDGSPTKVTWYDVNFDASTFTLTHNTDNTVKPGTTVTETYKAIDQEGAPINDMAVDFLRTGPDTLQNGNGSGFGYTNDKGIATYIFQGTKAGKAIITGIMHNGDDGDPVVPASQVNDTVTFAAAGKATIHPKLKLSNSGAKDVATVRAGRAAKGAKVTFYRVNANGHAVKIGTARIGANGKVTKKFRDRNGHNVTRYFARVGATAKTLKAKTPTRGIR